MSRRPIVIALHWLLAFLLLAQLDGGSSAPVLRWAFVGTGALWLGLMALGGPLGRPGPKLTGALRAGFVPFHLAIYGLIALAVALNAAALTGFASDTSAWNAMLALLALTMFHAIFHLWRHSALRDGALRMIIPRVWHKLL